jgi:DNA helicase-2/ATP-dependent DNA helicase PcrA
MIDAHAMTKVESTAELNALLADLNDPQRQAVLHQDGPLLILAGPGSGKTRVVTRRAAYLARTAARPEEILAITFTNKAAGEMRERLGSLSVGEGMMVATFHAFCARLLRWYHERAGVPRNFTIFDTDDRRRVLKDAIEQAGLSSENWTPATMEREVSAAKNELLDAEQFAQSAGDWRSLEASRVYIVYEQLMREMVALDFDDLLMRTALLLGRDPELCDELEDRYRYVLVDEYQDTNAAQYRIARLLTQRRKNLCVTGDPDQSIYAWRGANIRNILSFENDYPDARVVRLEQNYRSTQRILSAAGALIANNARRKEKTLWTTHQGGAAVRIAEFESAQEEAQALAREIVRHVRNGGRFADVAVFYRVNSLSRLIEEALLRAGVAYQIARGTEFYNRKEIKDVLAYLRVLVNPSDEVALLRIINTPPRGVGATTIARLTAAAKSRRVRVYDILTDGECLTELGRSAAKVREFGLILVELSRAAALPAPTALEFVMRHSGLMAMYAKEGDDEDSPARNLDELLSAATEFHSRNPQSTIMDWLEHTALVSDVDSIAESDDRATLMTLHAAKGLEFPVVYIIGLEEGLLPFRRGHEEPDWEEERRLLFVGMTRARRELTLSRAQWRTRQGATIRTVRSTFLDELPRHEVEWVEATAVVSSTRPEQAAGAELPSDVDEWCEGTLVRHPSYGLGRIMALHRGAQRTHVDVLFKSGTRVQWVLEFAKLARVAFDEVGDLD